MDEKAKSRISLRNMFLKELREQFLLIHDTNDEGDTLSTAYHILQEGKLEIICSFMLYINNVSSVYEIFYIFFGQRACDRP